MRKCFRGDDYFYFKVGARRRFMLTERAYVTPSVFAEGGCARNQTRVLGARPGGGAWESGVSSVSFRLEAGWCFSATVSAFVFVEQYGIVGGDERRANSADAYRCAHDDWTHGGMGLRLRF